MISEVKVNLHLYPEDRIIELLDEARSLPDPTPGDLFDVRSIKTPIIVFFGDLLRRIQERHHDVIERTLDSDLTGSVVEVYRRLNGPKHPVRNGLLMAGITGRDDKEKQRPDQAGRNHKS